jgi:hypothetical protein
MNSFGHAIARFFAWLIEFVLKQKQAQEQEKPKVSQFINIGGKAVPLADIEKLFNAVPTALRDYAAGKSKEQIVTDLKPTLIDIGEDVANIFFPGAGTAIEVVLFILSKARPMTQEETNAWMDRFGSGSQS